MSSITPSPLGPATTARRGTMSAADKTKVDALTGTNTGDVTVSSPAGWLSVAAQVVTFALVAAEGALAGVVNGLAQTFAGVKTFASKIIAAIGLEGPAVWNTNGSGASDVCVKVGTQTSDGSVNAAAKLWAVVTGLGGTEVIHAWFQKAAVFDGILRINQQARTNTGAINLVNSGAGDTGLFFEGGPSAGGCGYGLGGSFASGLSAGTTNRTQSWSVNGDAFSAAAVASFAWSGGGGGLGVKDFARYTASAAHTGNLAAWYVGAAQVAALDKDGAVQLNMAGGTRPAATAAQRGKLWYSKAAGGVPDTIECCLKSAADSYSWVTIGTG